MSLLCPDPLSEAVGSSGATRSGVPCRLQCTDEPDVCLGVHTRAFGPALDQLFVLTILPHPGSSPATFFGHRPASSLHPPPHPLVSRAVNGIHMANTPTCSPAPGFTLAGTASTIFHNTDNCLHNTVASCNLQAFNRFHLQPARAAPLNYSYLRVLK